MPRVPRLSPKAERKVLSARSYLSLSVVAVASGHDQSEVSIPGYQSAPSAYIIVRSLGHCLSTVVNHILFPRLRFRFIYLSEKRIATVLVANSRALLHVRAHVSVRGQTRARARLCRWTHVQNPRDTYFTACVRECRRIQAERGRESERGEKGRKERERERERERTMCSKLASSLDRRTCERERGPGDRNERLRFLLSTQARPSSTTV